MRMFEPRITRMDGNRCSGRRPRRHAGVLTACLVCLVVVTPSILLAQGQSTVVGFYKMQLTTGMHLIAPPLPPLALESGKVATVTTNQITDANANWTTDQWAGHQLIFTSGRGTGWRYLVTDNTANSLTLLPDPIADGVVVAGDSYEILPNLEEYFGDQLRGGEDAGSADRIAYYDPDVSATDPVLLWKDGNGFWRKSDGTFGTQAVVPGQGFWLNLVGDTLQIGQTRTLVLKGRLNTWPGGGVALDSGPQVLSVPAPVNLVLGNVDWQALGAKAGGGPEESDKLGFYDENSGQVRWAWLSSRGWDWAVLDATTTQLPISLRLQPGQGYVYLHRGNGFFFNWSKLP